MNSCVSNTVVSIPCDICETSTRKSLTWIKGNEVMYCKCGCMVDLKEKSFLADIEKATEPLFGPDVH